MATYNDEQTNNNINPEEPKAGGYKVEDDCNLDEKALKRTIFGGNDANPDQPGYESHGMGGHAFGEINETRSGDDPANPSRNAGYTNEYFRRTEPSEEHPENHNFKPEHQEGTPDEDMGKQQSPGYENATGQQSDGGAEGNPDKIQEGTASYHDGDDIK